MTSSAKSVVVLRPGPMMRTSHAVTLDVLETANRIAAGLGSGEPFRIEEIAVGISTRQPAPADLVILPSLGLATKAEFSAARADGSISAIAETLAGLKGTDTLFATSCSGVFAFAHAGLLDGRSATVTWWLAPYFSRLFPDVQLRSSELVVEDGPVMTAGAALAHADLMLRIVERCAGYAIARECMRYLVLDERRSQSAYTSVAGLVAGDPVLLKAKRYVQANMAEDITVRMLSDAAGLTPRTFARRLQAMAAVTPIGFIQQLRLARAVDLALTTRFSSDQIADKVGYSDANALRRVMKKQTGKTIEMLRN